MSDADRESAGRESIAEVLEAMRERCADLDTMAANEPSRNVRENAAARGLELCRWISRLADALGEATEVPQAAKLLEAHHAWVRRMPTLLGSDAQAQARKVQE